MILVIGPSFSGKSLLLKALKSLDIKEKNEKSKRTLKTYNKVHAEDNMDNDTKVGSTSYTLPTIGTNIIHAVINKKSLTLYEVGGTMAAIWKSYFEDTDKLIFVIDGSAPEMTSTALVYLLEMLTHEALKKTPILILLNKDDVLSTCSPAEIRYMLHLNEISTSTAHSNINIITCSAKTGTNLQSVADWITAK